MNMLAILTFLIGTALIAISTRNGWLAIKAAYALNYAKVKFHGFFWGFWMLIATLTFSVSLSLLIVSVA